MGAVCSSSDVQVLEPTMDMKSSGSAITDLDLKIKTWAVPEGERFGIKHPKKARIEINWDCVTFTPLQPVWKERKGVPQQHNSRIVYSSIFTNNTGEKAEHNLKVERKSKATWTTSILNGYSTGISLGLSLALPNEIVSATADFDKTVKVETTETKTNEKEQTWSVDTVVPAPPHTNTKVRVEVREHQWSGDFTLPVIIKGKILVNFYDKNNPTKLLGNVDGDAKELLPQWGAEVEGSKVKWVLRGTCNFEYGVEHVTVVEHEAIPTRGSGGGTGQGQVQQYPQFPGQYIAGFRD